MKDQQLVLTATLMAAALAACAGGSTLTTTMGSPMSAPTSRGHAAHAAPSGPTLYVLNSQSPESWGVSIYSNGGASLLRSLSLGRFANSVAADPLGHLFVPSAPAGPWLLNVYENRGARVVQTLHQQELFGLLTLDRSGNLYTLCSEHKLCEYAADGHRVLKQRASRKIELRKFGAVPEALAVDASGDVAVSSGDLILVFAPGTTTPYWTIMGISAGAIAFDPSGDLYVVELSGSADEIAEYAPGGTSPVGIITNGIVNPTALAFDGAGNLYVLNAGVFERGECTQPPAVTVYSAGGSKPILSMTQGLNCGQGHEMALDPSASVYVTNQGVYPSSGNVIVYPPGSSKPKRTVSKGIQNPFALAIGP
jgi:hypothetical protein